MQSYSNHTKWDPKFHFVVFPILLVNVFYRVYEMLESEINFAMAWEIVVALALLILMFTVRIYALKVQDRVIRLEERLRLERLLPEASRSRIGELTEAQLIGLRFASDAELPALMEDVLKTQMGTKQIKQAIKNWRPDEFRV
jgi:hypothetical protein